MTKRAWAVAVVAVVLSGCGRSSDAAPSRQEGRNESKSSEPASTSTPERKNEPAPSAGSDSDPVGIAACDEYIAKATSCVGDTKALAVMKRKWKEKLASGTSRDQVRGACEMAAKLLKCKK